MAPPWPKIGDADPTSLAHQAYTLQAHCSEVMQFASEHPTRKANTQYVRSLAQITGTVVTKLMDQLINQKLEPGAGIFHAAPGGNSKQVQEGTYLSSTTSGACCLEQWNREVQDGSPSSGPKLTVPSFSGSSPPASLAAGDKLRIRIQWDGTSSPYLKMPVQAVRDEFRGIIQSSKNPAVAKSDMAGIEKLKSGDLDVYCYDASAQERLLHNLDDWLPQVQGGAQAHVLHNQYAILAHSTPTDFMPKSRAVNEAKEEILKENLGVIPQAIIVYLGWSSRYSRGDKQESSLIIAFDSPSNANRLLRGRVYLRGSALRTELYDPGLRITTCTQCFAYRHVAAICPASVRCPLCAESHPKRRCQVQDMPHQYRCCNCFGTHPAYDKSCPKYIEQQALLDTLKRKKAQFFPESTPAPPPIPIPIPNTTPPQALAQTEGLAQAGRLVPTPDTHQEQQQALTTTNTSELQALSIIDPIPRLSQAIKAVQCATADLGTCLPTTPTPPIAAANAVQPRDPTSLIAPIQKTKPQRSTRSNRSQQTDSTSSCPSARAEDADELAQLLTKPTPPTITFHHYDPNDVKYLPPSTTRKPKKTVNKAAKLQAKTPRKALAEINPNPTTTSITEPTKRMTRSRTSAASSSAASSTDQEPAPKRQKTAAGTTPGLPGRVNTQNGQAWRPSPVSRSTPSQPSNPRRGGTTGPRGRGRGRGMDRIIIYGDANAQPLPTPPSSLEASSQLSALPSSQQSITIATACGEAVNAVAAFYNTQTNTRNPQNNTRADNQTSSANAKNTTVQRQQISR